MGIAKPFERALELVAGLATDEEVVIQRGATDERPDLLEASWFDYVEWDEFGGIMRRGDVVISHAEVGSMVTAIRAGKKPVAVPRLARFGEHVDDHQLQLAERFAERDLAVVCLPGDDLTERVAKARSSRPPNISARHTELRAAVAQAALGG